MILGNEMSEMRVSSSIRCPMNWKTRMSRFADRFNLASEMPLKLPKTIVKPVHGDYTIATSTRAFSIVRILLYLIDK
ncbi:unnamed protein product [Coffea canephora]|uniref:Uncharacterized protein n=1 Tax=Coffea canephora TaxID=49390 RepID=A0A068UGP8_COFCA|nr:unnamed protein product [Coffea canephora]